MEDCFDEVFIEEATTKKGRWTKEEDDMLRIAVDEFGEKQWRAVADKVPSRTTVQCFHRWTKILRPGLVKGPWSPSEDSALLSWVQREGPIKWTQCSDQIPGRTGKQCRERWFNTLDPDIKKGEWTDVEDKILFRLYQKMGPKWTEMTKCLPGRTENSIKNRFYSAVRKAKHRTPEELRRITELKLTGTEDLVSKATSVSMQVIALFQQMQALECLLNSTRQQIVNLEETIEMEERCLDESVGVLPVPIDNSIKHRILLRAAARKNQAADEFRPQGDAAASELITTLRKISLTPPRTAPKRPKDQENEYKSCEPGPGKPPQPLLLTPEPKVQTPLLRANTGGTAAKLQSDLSVLKESYDSDLSDCVDAVKDAAGRISAKQVAEIREKSQPGPDDLIVCEAFLALYAEIDSRIDVTPSFQVLTSCSWEAMQNYSQQPGHVVRMMRRAHELVLSSKISDLAVQRAKSFLRQSSPSAGSIWKLLSDFVTSVVNLHEAKRDAGTPAVQSFLKSLNTSRTPLSSNQTTMRTMDESLPTISVSLLSECGFACESFRRETPSPSGKENSPMSSFRMPGHRAKQRSVSTSVRETQWKLDDFLREFIRSKMLIDPLPFLTDIETNRNEVLKEFKQKIAGFVEQLPVLLQTQAVSPFLATLTQDSVLEDVARMTLRLCPGTI